MNLEKVKAVLTLLPMGKEGKANEAIFLANSWRIAPKAPSSAEEIKQPTLN